MTYWLSDPIESLLPDDPDVSGEEALPVLTTDRLVVGSGYGAAMAALAMAEQAGDLAKKPIWVFERGNEYLPEDFPKTIADLPGFAGLHRKQDTVDETRRKLEGLWDIRVGDGITTVCGNGLGGTSLINANVAARPDPAVLEKWPALPENRSWQAELSAVFPKIERLLGVQAHPDPEKFPKYRAFQRTVKALDGELVPAPVSINFNGPSPHSADHGPCNACGNCVIGCHSGAKGSLNMNAWPLAIQLGVQLFTGATVQAVKQLSAECWELRCNLSRQPHIRFLVRCRLVVLAAGTLGSTQILLHSAGQLALSPMLGNRFSANGDALAFSTGQHTPVNAAAVAPVAGDHQQAPGPTILGKAHISKGGFSATLEDGAIPYPLLNLWQETMVTQGLLRRYTDSHHTDWHAQHPGHDFLAISDELMAHGQVLLIMGVDDSSGSLTLDASGTAVPAWPAENAFLQQAHTAIADIESSGFDGGHFQPGMNWELLPPGFNGVMAGAEAIRPHLLSVHPLGGCCMGDSPDTGIVNVRGQVFNTAAGGVYQNLYILDGAILPVAVGTNPFLTIAALSYHLALGIDQDQQSAANTLHSEFPALVSYRKIPAGTNLPLPAENPPVTRAVFSERLVAFFDKRPRSDLPWSQQHDITPRQINRLLAKTGSSTSPDGPIPDSAKSLVLDISFEFSGNTSIEAWLRDPQQPINARAQLSYDPFGSVLTTPSEHCFPVGEFTGTVLLGRWNKPGWLQDCYRRLLALYQFRRLRPFDLPNWLLALLHPDKKGVDPDTTKREGLFSTLRGYWRVAGQHSHWRELVYDLIDAETGCIQLKGIKTLAYAPGKPGLLEALMVLPLTITNKNTGASLKTGMEVDPVRITRGPAPLQIQESLAIPHALVSLTGMGTYFLRMLMQTHFWSFAAPSYPFLSSKEEMDADPVHGSFAPPPDSLLYMKDGRQLESAGCETFFELEPETGRKLRRLIRYQPRTGSSRTLLLIHGLAHSGRVFWTETVDCNAVQYFLARDYDVWVIDHRTSANYVDQLDPDDTWDDIALSDIPWAVDTIFNSINPVLSDSPRKIHVFSHCIGAGAAAIAVLAGKLNFTNSQGKSESKLASLVPHAVTPWLFASAANRSRENIWALFKDLGLMDFVEPCPDRDATFLEIIYDRLSATSLTDEERGQWRFWKDLLDHRGPAFPRTLYTRYTLFWGRQWHKPNISQKTRYAFAGMVGAVPVAVLQQVYFSITRGLLSAHDGNNSYVTADTIATHWTFPTLFLHGDRNTVFDIESSRLSAEQLTRHRLRQQGNADLQNGQALQPLDYLRQNVWIEVLNDFGHMDMIFGQRAPAEAFPKLHRFFTAAETGQLADDYSDDFTNPEETTAFMSRSASRSHYSASTRPQTGPIISHPRRRGDKAVVRLWCEAEDFTADRLNGLKISLQDGTNAPATDRLILLDHEFRDEDGDNTHLGREFWLYDYEFTPEHDFRRRLWLDYAGNQGDPAQKGITLDWSALDWYQRSLVDTTQAGTDQTLQFLAGSCLHPGSTFESEQSASIFDGMLKHLSGINHVLFLGDQIYADASAGLFDPRADYEKYRVRYRKAFASNGARQLFASVPAYFAVDDHEFTDNWQGDAAARESAFDYARKMSWLFQSHHRNWDYADQQLWFDFESQGRHFFVFDTRFERQQRDRSHLEALISQDQLAGFKAWLTRAAAQSRILFLVTGSPLAPISRDLTSFPSLSRHSDTLVGYQGFLGAVGGLLAEYAETHRFIWLSGDPHFSSTALLTLSVDEQNVPLIQLCCSGLYAPMPFANSHAGDHLWDTPYEIDLGCTSDHRQVRLSGIQSLLCEHPQHFVKISQGWQNQKLQLQVSAHDASGKPVGDSWQLPAEH